MHKELKEHMRKLAKKGGKAKFAGKSEEYKRRFSMKGNAAKRKKNNIPCPIDKDRICWKDDKAYLAGMSCPCHL